MPIKVQGGKEYQLVSERLVKLREKWPDATIETQVEMGSNHGLIGARIILDGRFATGHAMFAVGPEKALEKAETTAVGRALAFLDPDLMGSEIASADEMKDFHDGQAQKEALEWRKRYGFALQNNLQSLAFIQAELVAGNLASAWEAFNEIDEDDRQVLRVAATKGGWLSVEESKLLGEASKQDFDSERGVYASIADKGNENE